mmetsp:Transcript_48332/g.125348  ORF Transcript_48332/g.125348 Transcript_48332/m.125348 type:complete len:358 (+) Transcript_48332:772-1845(+)
MWTAAASSIPRAPRFIAWALVVDCRAASASLRARSASARGTSGDDSTPVMSASSSLPESRPSLKRSRYIRCSSFVSVMNSPIALARASVQRWCCQPSLGSQSMGSPSCSAFSLSLMAPKILGSSKKASCMAAGFLCSTCSIRTSRYAAKMVLANSFFSFRLSPPHQANTRPLPCSLHSAKIAPRIASMTGAQNFLCSSTTLPALTDLSSGGSSVHAAFMKSTPCVSIAWNHSAGFTTALSLNNLRNSALGVALGMPYLCMAAAFMMLRMETTAPKRPSSHEEMELSKCAMPVADSTRGYGDCPKEITRHPDGGFGFNACSVSSRMGTICLGRPGPMKPAAFGNLSITGRSMGSHTAP